ncbi:tyrosine-type recombinase/integrase [Actinomadura viridis]|uniref:tyrosine-type recombinase/integrase n=1 Tax=Actinomadura viridis TaxID=58110 RepID=UPI003690C220
MEDGSQRERQELRDALLVLLEAWRLSLRSEHTRTAYASDMTDWLAFCAQARVDPLRQARRAHVDAWVQQLRTRPVRGGRPPSQATLARRLSTISSFYRYTVTEGPRLLGTAHYTRLGLLDHNPAATPARPRVSDQPKGRGLDRHEFTALLEAAAAAGHRDAAVTCLLGRNGLRVSSVCTADVDSLGRQGRHRILTYWLKRDRTQQTALSFTTWTAIEGHLRDRDTGAHPEQHQQGRPRPLILDNDGGRLDRFQVDRIVKRLARAAGLEQPKTVTPHSLRRAFITHARRAGAEPEHVQDAADHQDPRTTRRYQQADDRFDHSPTYLLEQYLSPYGPPGAPS